MELDTLMKLTPSVCSPQRASEPKVDLKFQALMPLEKLLAPFS